jgi:cytidylate kinase
MYRAATVYLMRAGGLDKPDEMPKLIAGMPLRISLDPNDQRVCLGTEDVTDLIRSTDVSVRVSRVSTVIPARALLVARQRSLVQDCADHGIVVEGRDITTVVAPDAAVRVLITASPEVRLRRRAMDQLGQTSGAAMAATADEVLRRDRDDSTVARFIEPGPGVVVLDTSDLTVDQVVDAVAAMVPSQ